MPQASTRNRTVLAVVAILLALGAGLLVGWLWRGTAVPTGDRAAVEKIVREYILEHPEILPEAMQNLQKRENAQALSGIRDQVHAPFPGAVLGNPQGKVTLVEFTDYACSFCRQSVAEVEQLIAANPELRVVVRDLPILSPRSADAAKMALAAAEQGKYAAFHHAMFAAGQPGPETIQAAAQAAGLDLARAQRVIADPRIETELARNIDFARQLGFNGTPAWIAGDQLLSGAVGQARLAEAIEAAKKG
ncbi:DsbA family protein [Novosphingobium sp. PS1R-30]|uniref:DsbA family protein n=1 Tax=Novosphingobium anseongense TaxID=3133436 RepID=A0ABU8RWP8_9SPHN|nr:MAG: DsbA family protein [Novosphingobium sp.]